MNSEARLYRIALQTQQIINSATNVSRMEEDATVRERLLEEDQPRDRLTLTEILPR